MMQVSPEKIIDAIDALKAAADALLSVPHGAEYDKCSRGEHRAHAGPCIGGESRWLEGEKIETGPLAAECLKAASALQASVQIAGQTHRTFHATGVH
jgi:hypothetical protein